MSYGNPLLGTMKGKLGDVIFSRSRGRQQARAHVVSPANPKTLSQRGQRVKFGTASAFYRSAVKNLFKFAFEYKLQGESDYNAFMRYNLPDMACNTKSAYSRGLPCVSDWMLSNGTLRSADLRWVNRKPSIFANGNDVEVSDWTVGQVSRSLANSFDLQDGDIVTTVCIKSDEEVYSTIADAKEAMSLTTAMYGGASAWDIRQFVLDFKSVLPAKSLGVFDMDNSRDTGWVLNTSMERDGAYAAGCAVIFSRVTPRGLKVSTARLVLNDMAQQSLEYSKSEEWWRFCAENFDAAVSLANTPVNILEGAVADWSQYELVAHDYPYPNQANVSATIGDTQPVNKIHPESGLNIKEGILVYVEGDSAQFLESSFIGRELAHIWQGTATDWKVAIGTVSGKVWFIAPSNERMLKGIYYKGR